MWDEAERGLSSRLDLIDVLMRIKLQREADRFVRGVTEDVSGFLFGFFSSFAAHHLSVLDPRLSAWRLRWVELSGLSVSISLIECGVNNQCI